MELAIVLTTNQYKLADHVDIAVKYIYLQTTCILRRLES